MTDTVEISLIGAKTYGTLSKVYQKGEPSVVSAAVWEMLRNEVNPASGATLFCLTSELPPEARPLTSNDLSQADLRAAGLMGEIDTGKPVENTLDILKGDTSGSDPEGADPAQFGGTGSDLPPGEVTLEQALAADGDVLDHPSDSNTASTSDQSADDTQDPAQATSDAPAADTAPADTTADTPAADTTATTTSTVDVAPKGVTIKRGGKVTV